MWRSRFSANPVNRGGIAFVGGVFAMIATRLAGGCPSGHGLNVSVQLAVSGFIALIGWQTEGLGEEFG